MDSNQQDFETLRKLMALKRHEQPPPEYLDGLSGSIMSRIERGEGRQNLWDRITANFAVRPVLAYACGLTVCGALGLGTVYLIREEMTQTDTSPVASLKSPGFATSLLIKPAGEPPIHVANWLRNTNPTAESQPEFSLFTAPHTAMPVAYQPGN
jgi:hypothetical protein